MDYLEELICLGWGFNQTKPSYNTKNLEGVYKIYTACGRIITTYTFHNKTTDKDYIRCSFKHGTRPVWYPKVGFTKDSQAIAANSRIQTVTCVNCKESWQYSLKLLEETLE